MKLAAGVIVAAAVAASSVRAAPGATQSEFLKIGLSARAAGMGGAFGAVGDDLGAMEYNPAGLGLLDNSQVSAMYSRWLADINFGAIAGAHVLPVLGTVGAALNFLDLGTIEGSESSFRASSFLVRAGWGRSVLPDLTVGGELQVLNERISDFSSSGGTVNAGVLWVPTKGVTLGASAMNLGVASAFESERDSLPMLVKFSGAWKGLSGDYGMLITAADVDYRFPPDGTVSPAFGLEYWGGRYFALRAGYAVKQTDLSGLVGFSAGIGVRWESLRVDYAFAPFSTLGVTHRVTLNWEIWPLVSLSTPGSAVGETRMISGTRLVIPAPPYVTAEAGEGNVLLKWEAPTASALGGYNVYVKAEGEDAFRKYNDEPVTATTLIVGDLEKDRRYFFQVRAVDTAAPPRESAPSPQATAIPY